MGSQLRDALKAASVRSSVGSTPRKGGSVVVRTRPEVASRSPAESPRTHARETSQPAASPKPVAVVAPQLKPTSRLVQIGRFHPHPLFAHDAGDEFELPDFGRRGVARQLAANAEDETDLIIGLDFGTSATKMVIRDRFAATSVFPVPFSEERRGIDGYLLPSRVFRTGDVYSLSGGAHRTDDLKLALLAGKTPCPVNEFNDCCAFLALVIRHGRGWLFERHRDTYGRHQLNWRLNLGLAARSYQDRTTVDLFRRLAWAAANVAADRQAEHVTVGVVERYRQASLAVFASANGSTEDSCEFRKTDVDAVPEVSAQLQGFMMSARWDWKTRPVMMLVDVGAGTVDSALFCVNVPNRGPGALIFWASRVEPNGVMNLHRDRVKWLQSLLPEEAVNRPVKQHLAEIAIPTDRIRPIPASVREYLPGYKVDVAGEGVDESFWTRRYRAQIAGSILDAKVGKGIRSSQLERVPLLLCGGGSRMQFYSRIGDAINSTEGWNVSVETMRLPVPQDLASTGWHAEDFDRLSVAYGLSLAGNDDATLGKIVREIDVPNVGPRVVPEREDRFISKDQL